MMIPFAAIFFLGVFWKRITTAGVLSCVGTALVSSSLFMWNSVQMAEGGATFIPFMDNPVLKPFLHTAMVSGAVCVTVLVLVSLFTKQASAEQLATTTIQGGPLPRPTNKSLGMLTINSGWLWLSPAQPAFGLGLAFNLNSGLRFPT